MTPATDPALTLNGVRQGDPCWVVPLADAALPKWVPAAVLVRVADTTYAHHGRVLYGPGDVFASEADARRCAYERARWSAEYHRPRLAAAEAVLAALADEAPVANDLGDAT